MIITRLIFFILLLGLSSEPFISFAYNPNVVINEIAWMGTKVSSNEEWIELYNPANKEVDISGWEIENAGAKNNTLEISAGKIPAYRYFLICRKEIGNCDLVESKLSLHNKYDKNGKLVLKNKAGDIIDATPEAVNQKWPAGNNQKPKKTMERICPLALGSELKNWQTSQSPGGTPRDKNSPVKIKPEPEQKAKPEPIVYPKNIFINEILPSPKGSDAQNEWIEIFNENNFEVDLSGWKIQDVVGTITTYSFPKGAKIQAKGFLVLRRPTSKITLQNSGDTLKLIQPNGNIINKVTYKKALLNQSYNLTQKGWQWSQTLTPGRENVTEQIKVKGSMLSASSKKSKALNEKAIANKKTISNKTALANINKNINQEFKKGNQHPLITFFMAVSIAIGSGIVVLIIKKRVNA